MFVALFGSLLAAYALAQVFEGKMRVGHLALLVLAAGWSASPYLSPHHATKPCRSTRRWPLRMSAEVELLIATGPAPPVCWRPRSFMPRWTGSIRAPAA